MICWQTWKNLTTVIPVQIVSIVYCMIALFAGIREDQVWKRLLSEHQLTLEKAEKICRAS